MSSWFKRLRNLLRNPRSGASVVVASLLLAAGASAQGELTLSIEAGPDPARPGATVNVALTVTNSGTADVANVTLQVNVPETVDSFAESLASGGTCNQIGSSAACERGEPVI